MRRIGIFADQFPYLVGSAVLDEYQKLLPRIPADDGLRTEKRTQLLCDGLQHQIAHMMPVAFIEVLETIHFDQHQRRRFIRMMVEVVLCVGISRMTAEELGQRIIFRIAPCQRVRIIEF